MPKVTKKCRVCGKEYTVCYTPNWGVFRWQDVACSKECGQIYLERITASRAASMENSGKAEDQSKDEK